MQFSKKSNTAPSMVFAAFASLWAIVAMAAVLLLLPNAAHAFAPPTATTATAAPRQSTQHFLAAENGDGRSAGLNIAVVGSGPSGLLLSHFLRRDPDNRHRVTLFDGRSDPRNNELEGRAYALGIGIRGRAAIRAADPALWDAVKARGYESERFQVYLGVSPKRDLVVPLRSESSEARDSPSYVEPSVLLYQSELCASLLTELEEGENPENNDWLDIHFNSRVVDCDLDAMTVRALASPAGSTNTTAAADGSTDTATSTEHGPFDLIVGCDGVNSRVRASIDDKFPEFTTTREKIPGSLKVVRLGYPVGDIDDDGKPAYDPTSVCILIPSGAFIEPTGADGSCCILFSGRGGDDTSGLPVYLTERKNTTAVTVALRERFPRWKEEALPEIVEQLMAQDLGGNAAYSVTCNTYHYQDKAVLLGDAAHATGGISGQGVNSALVDARVLAESLRQTHGTPDGLGDALLAYSAKQIPEGRALYDLSFGPKPQGWKKKLSWGLKNLRDAIFRGRLGIGEDTLQTRLSSELTPFAEIRRERDYYYATTKNDDDEDDQEFPSDADFRRQIEALHNSAKKTESAVVSR